jgi:hypothetical protein
VVWRYLYHAKYSASRGERSVLTMLNLEGSIDMP